MNKKISILILFLVIIVGNIIIWNNLKKIDYQKDWYVEIKNDFINLRTETSTFGNVYGKVKKGEKYLVLDMVYTPSCSWYKIKYNNKKEYWIANPKNENYLKDYNNPKDYMTPVLKYEENTYKTYSINTIDYKHLIVEDDKKDYKISHVVYKDINEQGDCQYWIIYKVEDKSGKSSSVTQKIEFEEHPNNDLLEDIKDIG